MTGRTTRPTTAHESLPARAIPERALWLTGDGEADALLSTDPFALLVGMVLDQQVPMETAFAGPLKIVRRFGTLDPLAVAAADPEDFELLCRVPPAVHRYPGAMAARIQGLARVVSQDYDGDASLIWNAPGQDGSPADGHEVRRRLESLPGFGKQKAQIFLALLGKQQGLTAPGWREAAGPYGEEGTARSIADVTDPVSLQRVRDAKRAAKRAAKEG